MNMLQFCEWLATTWLARLVTESQWGFPIIVAIHLLGLGLSVGTIIWMDLRLLGRVLPNCPVSIVYRRLAPWALTGFATMFISGVMLFVGYAPAAYANTFFRIKLVALLVAGLNAAIYHVTVERRIVAWDNAVHTPVAARAAGLISITVWMVVILAGRAMSYTMF
jgi:hypothetical protein